MPALRERIETNLQAIRRRIAQAARQAGRAPEDVALIAVTKSVGLEEVRILQELGVTHFGENRVEQARAKLEALRDGSVRWHMIGSVQRRKVAEVAALFDSIDSVDRLELARTIDQRCAEQGKTLSVLVEVNVSGEASKHGFEPGNLEPVLDSLRCMNHIKVEGLMTMAPFLDDPEEVRPVFARLRELAKPLGLNELSMGMSNDFEVAIQEGATQVRIGTALFA